MPAHCAARLFSFFFAFLFPFACADQKPQTLLAILPFVPLVSSPAHTPCSEIQLLSNSIHRLLATFPSFSLRCLSPRSLCFHRVFFHLLRFLFCPPLLWWSLCKSWPSSVTLSSPGVFVEDIFWRY